MNKLVLGIMGASAIVSVILAGIVILDTRTDEPGPVATPDASPGGDASGNPEESAGTGPPRNGSNTPSGVTGKDGNLSATVFSNKARVSHDSQRRQKFSEGFGTAPSVRRDRDAESSSPGPRIAGEVEFQLAFGVRRPIADLEPAGELTPVQQYILSEISGSFLDRVASMAAASGSGARTQLFLSEQGQVTRFFVPDTETGDPLAEAWDDEREDADSTYRNVFGEAAYQQMRMEAVLRARGQMPENRSGDAPKAANR